MAGKVVTTAAPTREETAAARSYVGSTRASGNGLNVKEKAGSDASKVNYYRGSGAAASISATLAQRQQYNQRMDNARLWAQTDEIRGYLNSGQTNRQATNQWLETANTEAQNAKSEDAKNHWANIANALNSQLKSDYWNELETTKTELSKAQEAEATTRKNRDNASIATTSGVKFVDGRDSFTVLKEANQQLAQNVNNAKELSARLEALQAEFEDRFKPDDVRQAEARLTANRGYVTEYGDEMTDVKAADQALVDEWRASMGLNPKYFNTQDKIDAFARDKFFGLAAGAMNTAAVGLQWLDQSSDEMVRAQYDAEHGEGAYDKAVAEKNVNVLGDAGRSLNKAAINANEEAQRDIAKIKQDMSKFGQFGVDLASTALDVGFDAASGLGLVSMGVRTFGQSALEAQARGADLSGQIKYGLANTAIELATEKISDGLGLVYGKGVSTDITEKAIEKLAKTKAGADLLRFIAGAGGEGVEEVVSDLLSPFANWIIDEQARNNKVYDVDPSELLYDFLLGAAVGAFGQAGEVATGEYAAKEAEYVRSEQARFDEKLASGERFNERDVKDYNRLESRIDSAEGRQSSKAKGGDSIRSRIGNFWSGDREQVKTGNREFDIANGQAERAEALGYVKPTLDRYESYQTATGKTVAQAEAEAAQAEGKANEVSGRRTSAKSQLPDTPETVKSESERILNEIKENDSHIEEDHRPSGGGVLYWTKSMSRESIQDILERKQSALKPGEKLSRDAEFEAYTDDEGNRLSLTEAAAYEASGETVHRWRAIDQNVVEEMTKATPEAPYVVGGRFGATYKFFIFDGTRLRIVKSTAHGEGGDITIDSDDTLPAGKFETAAVYLSECLKNRFSGKSPYDVWSGEHDINGNQKNNDRYLRFITDTTANQTEDKGPNETAAPDTNPVEESSDIAELPESAKEEARGIMEFRMQVMALHERTTLNGCDVKRVVSGYKLTRANGETLTTHDLDQAIDFILGNPNGASETAVNASNSRESSEGINSQGAPAQKVKPAEESTTEPAQPQESEGAVSTEDIAVESEPTTNVAEARTEGVEQPEPPATNESTPQETAETESTSSARTPGTTRTSQSAIEQELATRGERNTTRAAAKEVNAEGDVGDGTFVSRTNEDRSRTANFLTDTQEKKEAETRRLIDKNYSWNDDDVVIAQKLMSDKLKAIRDYQLSTKKRMPYEAFKKLTKEYNELVLKHKAEKSRMGQALQAEYVFSEREKIMQRAAKAFLGFSKDGTFTGNAAANNNVKLYRAMENATDRIAVANERGDAKALAQICKDVSDIRNVRKMFGRAANFASEMENRILEKIAKTENGVQALTTLAYGNVNAICDDIQPYKAINAAKTIRIMNMLSNMSTIMNNIVNNAASGLTSTNTLAQWATDKAANAFRGISGEPVVAKAQKGWFLNSDIRSAEIEALRFATLMQMYGVNQENGKLEISGDKGLFNPNVNKFEQTMALYKFFVGMGVEATDQVKSAGLQRAMQKGIDDLRAEGKITDAQKAEMEREAKHEVDRLLYKDENKLANTIQYIRDRLNDVKSWGNDDIGTIGLGDITMAFAKVPANVVRARLYATPEGAFLQTIQYMKGVQKAKRMHSEVVAKGILENYAKEKAELDEQLRKAYELAPQEFTEKTKSETIEEIKTKLGSLERKVWAECREKCSGAVYNNLTRIRKSYGTGMTFEQACNRAHISDAKEMSQFEMAQLSRKIGKAATSSAMLAVGAVLRAFGALRDFDQEPDDELRKMYAQKGYRGLMLNLSAIGRPNHEWRDGDNVIGADFLEVVAMPLAIGATAAEAADSADGFWSGTKKFALEMSTGGLSKAFEAVGDIPGMADAINLYDAITSQFNTDNAAKGSKVANSIITYAANSLPSFFIPNAFSQAAAGLDNTMRDVYTTDNIWQQAWNIIKNKGGILVRQTIPASVDMWGNERTYGEDKFWGVINKAVLPGDKLKYRQNAYETEIIRLSKAGFKSALPKISMSSSFEVNGETYTMDADEKLQYRQNRNKAQATAYQAFMDSDIYKQLDDVQRVAVLKDLKMTCERDAKQTLLGDRGLDVEISRAKWETELETKDQITYLSKMQMAKAAWDSSEGEVSDYAAMDTFIQNQYGSMSQTMKDIADNSLTHLDDLYDAWNTAKITSEDWQTAYNIYRQYIATDEEGKRVYKANLANEAEMWSKIEKATGANKAQMAWYEDKMKLWYQGTPDTDQYYEYLNDAGLSRSEATTTIQTMSRLEALEGYSSVQYGQKYQVIVQTVPKAKQWDAFWSLVPSNASKAKVKKMHALQAQGVSLDTALKSTGMGDYYTKYVDSRGKTHKTKAN